MSRSPFLGLDVGGANLKLANSTGYARSHAFELWKRPHELAATLRELLGEAPAFDGIAATMTGELADCYEDKRDGVHAIVDAIEACGPADQTWIYLTTGEFATPREAKDRFKLAAASNWHALAQFAVRQSHGQTALLIDLGSTTCDVIPIAEGKVVARGSTDTERLCSGELLYLGTERTPISMIVQSAPYRGQMCGLAREVFATMLDALLLMGDTPEARQRTDTADGRTATVDHAVTRLSHCVCACPDEFSHADAVELARYVVDEAAALIRAAIERLVVDRGWSAPRLMLTGHGNALLRRALASFTSVGNLDKSAIVNISDTPPFAGSPEASRCAPSVALAVLAEESNLNNARGTGCASD